MEEYFIDNKKLYNLLIEKGITAFFHANTVLTSLTFIRERALLSRKFVEQNNLIQTDQKSDEKDKKYGVWDDVFLDAFDIHKKYNKRNLYGPVMFVFKLEMLLSPSISQALVTKCNPINWSDTLTNDDKYYSSIDQIKDDYLTGKKLDSQIMITFRSPDKCIKLNKFLKGILVDKPSLIVKIKRINGDVTNGLLGDEVFKRLEEVLKESGLGQIALQKRHSLTKRIFCRCQTEYNYLNFRNYEELRKLFRMNY